MINDSIFQQLIKTKYRLEGKTRVWDLSDSKLWYLTPKQAQGFLDLENNINYSKSLTENEINLIDSNFNEILVKLRAKAYNIVDIGCGDGKKASLFIKKLSNHFNIRYCPIDISSYMVKKASENIRKLKVSEVVELNWNISDFENLENVTSLFRDSNFKRNIYLFLGNTMGNFKGDIILQAIRKSMKKGDILIIGNGIYNPEFDEVSSYKTKEIDNFLYPMINLISLKKEDINFDCRFIEKESRIEMFYVLNKNKTITNNNQKIEFKKGDYIVTGISYKYSKPIFKKILNKFFNTKVFFDKDETYALSLCGV
ncbi:MAG: L-histidine N(alpha)-methyltransferase [archaeon]|jgi:uncharacterized SAM-dependent methyltransferase|nr:L-histidine N(alpha)-methyltransferase [archaeon]MDD2477665.1 L-histidine N(alpha)-methyltransferase [Candidatus ainarchaeum sp.]MDD3084391.1 L-histidine N(alpha)-methyltransferase [Candidatus ainarchaeum sp.]MDD4220847.1 L-histidine N(alpha)-methyltransferase [Candidatus ainarchaeum sp.]MDD4662347.1 L-histidine N(alpha)-methyltransferase [Candidatus ainarchaeum sp.]